MINVQTAVIGGGASGLVAAIMAAREGASVAVIEHMDRAGKKILSTGNGRCNLTNLKMDSDCYRCSRKDFPMKVIEGFGVEETLGFFRGLGVVPKDRNGYIYPNSDQASSVLEVLLWEAGRLGVKILLSAEPEKITQEKEGGCRIFTGSETIAADTLVLAAGSKAAPSTGSDGSGYELARSLGHRIIKPLPALVQLRCQGNLYKQLAGIRTEAEVELYAENTLLAKDRGELQLTDYGLSGIPVFQISRFGSVALDQGKRVRVLVDFMPSWRKEEAWGLLKKRVKDLECKPAEELFTGMLNRKLGQVLLKLAGIRPSQLCRELSKKQLTALLSQLKSYEALVMSVNPFANAQVCCGGVDTGEVDPCTMESRIRQGLYLAGELLDVDGICGGYNLQFAWSSGALAGRNAARTALGRGKRRERR